jgi:hypothetical protein
MSHHQKRWNKVKTPPKEGYNCAVKQILLEVF